MRRLPRIVHVREVMGTSSEIEQGRTAYQQRAWSRAYESFAFADARSPLGADDLWRFALCAYLIGHEDEFLELLGRAHHAHLEARDPVAAARCAFWVGFRLATRREMAQATGWLGRAKRLLEDCPDDCVERGYLLLAMAFQKIGSGDHDGSFAAAAGAIEKAQRFGDADLLSLALHAQGRACLMQARVEEGLALLDEAMIAVAADELSPHVTGLIYCSVIGACRQVHALRRAHEWTAALTEWCARHPDMIAYSGECLNYRAEILQLHGAWREAIEEADRARERLAGGVEPRSVGAAYYTRGEVHRLLGAYGAAEEAYRQASHSGREPQPGLALLRLAQGRTDTAAAAIRRALQETRDRLQRARLLPAHIAIMLDEGAIEEASRSCEELEEIASTWRGSVLETIAAGARGAVLLARGDSSAALVSLREAWRGWQEMDAPYEAARVRVLLGRACRALEDEDTARLEFEAARRVFEQLGARPDVIRIDSLQREASSRPHHGLTPRELDVLTLVATGRTNRAIARELSISDRTVARHVSNIFGKLGLSSRSEATAYAWENDIVR